MPVTSTIVACPAGQWTSIAPYLDTRRTLIVNCPEVADVVTSTEVGIVNDDTTRTIIAADPLRKRLVISIGGIDASTTDFNFFAGTGLGGGFNIIPVAPQLPFVFDTGDSQLAAAKWSATVNGNGTHAQIFFLTIQVTPCYAIVLGINTSVDAVAGPGGTAPIGIWQSPDLSGGGSQFRLDIDRDGELVQQAWFVWPIGSGTVNINVLQTFDVPPERSALVVQLPSLSPHGKLAAWELLKAMRPKADDDAGLQDDQEF